MANNTWENHPFFFNNETGFENEKQTFAEIMDEAVNLHGAECLWISSTLAQQEDIFGEFVGKKINKGTPIRLYTESLETDFYPEDTALFTKFGFEPNIGPAAWHGTVNYFTQHGITPKQQDLIYYKKVNKMFEVTHIELIDGFKYIIDTILFNYDHVPLDPAITNADILTLDDLDDKDKALHNDAIGTVESTEGVIDTTDKDGIFG